MNSAIFFYDFFDVRSPGPWYPHPTASPFAESGVALPGIVEGARKLLIWFPEAVELCMEDSEPEHLNTFIGFREVEITQGA